ncbi:PIN domain-containing protein [Sphingomonas sp. MAH-20]|uniref:Ribonuclease VapC n=1 Tax=Sphingomonas horti TaxID=2682842 RepID=A0A6I4J2P4_9SPHN|nr:MULTISPECIES: type II toxin-antitoxin system VapC family toxin [Sphingomonas]MBA2918664.1 type II toxin-antitoxin system VapC family toxin [Sphingomonas sp. CGMCC 1.13658]MVO78695.1 PIN domain-containing protein [Sphingomonas horti]
MIVDTSALMAIIQQEPEQPAFIAAILSSSECSISAGSWVELGAVLGRRKPELAEEAESLLDKLGLSIAEVTTEQARIGHRAYLEFGRGRHEARLNFGDCFSYALAKATGRPLLFKGNDFVLTDIAPAL